MYMNIPMKVDFLYVILPTKKTLGSQSAHGNSNENEPCEGTFDHDNGQKFGVSVRRLH